MTRADARADRAGELHLDEVHELGVGDDAPRRASASPRPRA